MANINLTVKDIVEKEFKSGMNGYKKDEVDAFLDVVIKDYEIFRFEVEKLFAENEQLKRQMKEMSKLASTQEQSRMSGSTNFDILKRISNLEKAVFGNMINREL